MSKKIYIAGAAGMLGEGFYEQFRKDYILKCTDININSSWISYLDFRDFHSYKADVTRFRPDYLFHIGAHTDLEYCEINRKDAFETNAKSVEYAVKISNELHIPILYISTAGIFDGTKDFYTDDDQPAPISIYGESKYLGESYVKKHAKKFLICRAGWMMGGGPIKDKKFIQKIMSQIKSGKNELYVVDDKYGSPTYTHDFAKNVKLLLEKNCSGLFNLVCEGNASRLEVTEELINILNLDLKINTVSSDFFEKEYFAIRPNSECLVNERLNDLQLNIMKNWKSSLREYITKYYEQYLIQTDIIRN